MTIPKFLENIKLKPIAYDVGPCPFQNGLITDEVLKRYSDCMERRVSIKRASRTDDTWKIEAYGDVLSKSRMDFIYESMPTSRTDEFLKDTRFSSPEEALLFYQKFLDLLYAP